MIAAEGPALEIDEEINPTYLKFDEAALGFDQVAETVHGCTGSNAMQKLCTGLDT